MLGMTPTTFAQAERGRSASPSANARSGLSSSATGKGVCAILLGDAPEALVRELEDRFPRRR